MFSDDREDQIAFFSSKEINNKEVKEEGKEEKDEKKEEREQVERIHKEGKSIKSQQKTIKLHHDGKVPWEEL